MERLVLLLMAQDAARDGDEPGQAADIYVISVGEDAQREALVHTEQLRSQLPGLRVIQHAGGGSFKSQMKKADKSGAQVALIWGEDEVANKTVSVKTLRGAGDGPGQQTVATGELQAVLSTALAV
jgi:histidyl-tRNA synthetase